MIVASCLTKQTYHLLYYYFKLLGIFPTVFRDETVVASSGAKAYAILLSVVYTFLFIFTMKTRPKLQSTVETLVLIMAKEIMTTFMYLLNVCSWLLFAFNQNHLRGIVQHLNKIMSLMKKRSMKLDVGRLAKNVALYLLFTNLLYLMMFALNEKIR